MIGTIDIKVNAAKPNFPLSPFYSFVNSPSQVRVINVPRSIGKWTISKVFVTANYPDNQSASVECSLDGGCWHGTLPASTLTGTAVNGFTITANGIGEDGSTAVTGYVLGKGDVIILATDGTITVGETTYYVHIVDSQPANPKKGDFCKVSGVWKIYTGTRWDALGGGGGDISHDDFENVNVIDERYTLADVKGKVNEVLNILKGTVALAFAALLSFAANADITTQTARLDSLYNDSLVVTNVSGAATDPSVVSNIVESYGYASTNAPYFRGVHFTYENPSAFTVTTSNASYNAATGVASFSTAAGSGDAEGTVTFTPQNDWAKVYLRKCLFNSDAVLDEAGLGMPIEIKGIERDGKFVVQFKQIVALRCHGWASNIVIAVSDKYSDPHHINNTTNCDYQIQDEGGRWYLSNLRSWVMNAHNGDLGEDWADYPAKSDIHINSKRIIFDGNERYRLYVDESTNLIFRAGGMNGMTLGFHGTAVTNALMVTAMMVTNGIVDISFVLDNETFDPNELSVEALLRNGEWNGIAASRYVQKSINSVKFTALNSLSNELYRIKYGETYAPVLTVTLAGQVTIEGSFGINGTNIVAWMESQEAMISAGNPTFSNAVLAVGIGIDTNSVAVLNEIAAGFGGFPLDAGQSATTLGGLLAALAAAIAWLKRNKLTKGMTAGVPDDPNVQSLFTSDNTSLSSTIQTKIDATVGQINTALDTLNGEVA